MKIGQYITIPNFIIYDISFVFPYFRFFGVHFFPMMKLSSFRQKGSHRNIWIISQCLRSLNSQVLFVNTDGGDLSSDYSWLITLLYPMTAFI